MAYHPVCDIVLTGNVRRVNRAIATRVSLEDKNTDGNTALCVAADQGFDAIVSTLLKHGASPSTTNHSGRTALHLAALRGFSTVVQKLLLNKASPYIRDAFGSTPLELATQAAHEEVVKLLKVKINNDLQRIRSPACAACEKSEGMPSRKKQFMSNKVYQKMCLLGAVEHGHREDVEMFLTYGVSPSVTNACGRTALAIAASAGHESIVSLLLEKGTDINEKDFHGMTALHLAVKKGHLRVAEQLLRNGASCSVEEKNGKIPLDIAKEIGHISLVNLLEAQVKLSENFTEENSNIREALTQTRVICLMRHHKIKRQLYQLREREVWRAVQNSKTVVEMREEKKLACRKKKIPALWRSKSAMKRAGGPPTVRQSKMQCALERTADRAAKSAGRHAAKSAARHAMELMLTHLAALARKREAKLIKQNASNCVARNDGAIVKTKQKRRKCNSTLIPTGNPATFQVSTSTVRPRRRVTTKSSNNSGKNIKQCPIHQATTNSGVESITLTKQGTNKEAAKRHVPLSAPSSKKTPIQNPTRFVRAEKSAALYCSVCEGLKRAPFILIDIGYVDGNFSALHTAARAGHKKCLALLLNAGAKISQDKEGRTPLHEAVYMGHTRCIHILLKFGANVNATENKYGSSPLHVAALKGREDCVIALINGGANLLTWDLYSRTPLHISALFGHAECVAILIDGGTSVSTETGDIGRTSFHLAAMKGHLDCIITLLRKGAEIDCIDKFRNTPLHLAAREGHAKCVYFLLDHGANINLTDRRRDTALHMAARNGHVECISILLERGASVDSRGGRGKTSLNVAATAGHLNCIKLLVKEGANVNSTDYFNNTPLHSAAAGSYDEAVKLLIDAGANCKAKNRENETPLDMAGNDAVRFILS